MQVLDRIQLGNRAPIIAGARRRLQALSQQSAWQPRTIRDVYERHPTLRYPTWLQPIIDELESFGPHTRLLEHAPIQHGKTTLMLAFILMMCFGEWRGKRSFYLTYSAKQAEDKRDEFIHLCMLLGVQARRKDNQVFLHQGQLKTRTVVTFAGVGSSVTGKPITGGLVVDDPLKQQDAHSETYQERVWEAFKKDLYPRTQGGIAIIMSRWSVNDLTAKLVEEPEYGFKYIRLAAECDEVDDDGIAKDGTGRRLGELLWPEERNWRGTKIELLPIKNRDPRTWWSLYQGKPLIEGARIVEWPSYYASLRELPPNRIVRYGMDVAESKDWAVIYRVEADIRQPPEERVYYVTGGIRCQGHQVEKWGPEFGAFVKHRPAPVLWHVGGTENVQARFMKKWLPTLVAVHTRVSPHTRSLGLIEAINAGRVLFPTAEAVLQSATWVEPCVEAITNFDGVSHSGSDDLVSLNSAFVLINAKASVRKRGAPVGSPERRKDRAQNPDLVVARSSRRTSEKARSLRTPWSA